MSEGKSKEEIALEVMREASGPNPYPTGKAFYREYAVALSVVNAPNHAIEDIDSGHLKSCFD